MVEFKHQYYLWAGWNISKSAKYAFIWIWNDFKFEKAIFQTIYSIGLDLITITILLCTHSSWRNNISGHLGWASPLFFSGIGGVYSEWEPVGPFPSWKPDFLRSERLPPPPRHHSWTNYGVLWDFQETGRRTKSFKNWWSDKGNLLKYLLKQNVQRHALSCAEDCNLFTLKQIH